MTDTSEARSSPLLKSCGFGTADLERDASRWQEASRLIIDALDFGGRDLTQAEKNRVFHYYLPIVMWILKLKKEHTGDSPLVIGISAPQGCGKSTLVGCLFEVFAKMGMKAAQVSIDDFYLTHAEQKYIANDNQQNPLLQCRGNALTHDLPLGTQTLKHLKGLSGIGSAMIPRYDKSAFEGKGDRLEHDEWIAVDGPLDVILFEGWMLGFRPRASEEVASIDANLVPINEALRGYQDAWDAFVDVWLVIKVADPAWVGKWRLQAEHAMIKSGKPGMNDEAVHAFVNCYMPAYKAYLPELYLRGPTTAVPGKCLIIEVDEHRSPLHNQPEQIV